MMARFSSISEWVKVTKAKKDEVINRVFKSIGTTVINRTPIGDWTEWKREPSDAVKAVYRPGSLANNWYAGLGSASGWMDYHVRDPNPSAVGSLQSVEQVTSDAAGRIAHIVNPMPYAKAVEYGHSGQAPSGMVRVTVAEFGDIVRQEIKNVTG